MTAPTDSQGFLLRAHDWSTDWAARKAAENNLPWQPIDADIVKSLRDFYFRYDLSPAMRPLVRHIKSTLGPDQGNSIWLMQRYGESPARTLALLAGLPKPKNCL